MIDHARELLLISNSTLFAGVYLDHVETAIRGFWEGIRNVLFVPGARVFRRHHGPVEVPPGGDLAALLGSA